MVTQGTTPPEGRQAIRWVGPPDLLTFFRLPLAVMFPIFDVAGRLLVLALAAASDVADGAWARRIGGSRLGVILDPIADKVFMAVAFAVVWHEGGLHPLEIVAVLLRDLIAAAGALAMVLTGRRTLPARAGGKAVTMGQVLTLVASTAGSDLVRPLAWATAAIGLYAIADYGRALRPSREME